MTGNGHTNDDGVRRCIFHYPLPIDRNSPFGGQQRPARIIDALARWGEVWIVDGPAGERRDSMKRVNEAIRAGTRFDFCYSESSTMPTTMTGDKHLPTHPLLDFRFLSGLRRSGIEVGLFYRDIYWKFPVYGRDLPAWRRWAAKAAYRYDLLAYRRCLDVLFLPSLQMGELVPVGRRVRKVALPPGSDIDEEPATTPSSPLRLFYVGGLGDLYQLHELCAAVRGLPNVELTICTRAREWEAVKDEYRALMGPNISVVHASGKAELAPYFEWCNVAVLAMKPDPYRDFAAPLKLYEYIGNGKPILATENTMVGDVVADGGLGWTVPYSADCFRTLLGSLVDHPDQVDAAHQRVMAVRPANTWDSRVDVLATVLTDPGHRT